MFKQVVLFFAFLCCAVNAIAQDFSPATNYQAGTSPLAIAEGDFNGDGNFDLVVANTLSSSLSFFAGKGDGTFAPAVNIPLSGSPNSLAVADFNGDGKLDLAVSYITSTGLQPALQILYGNGDGTFQPAVTLLESTPGIHQFGVGKLVAADVNGDGKPDLLAGVNGLTVFLNNGTGGFTQAWTTMAGQTIQDFVVADLNGDGHADIAALAMSTGSSGTTGQAFVTYGNGDGTFQAATPLPFTTMTPGGIVVGDFNEDGRMDIILSDYGQGTASGSTNGSIQIALQQPDGSFTKACTLTGIANPWKIVAADFDGDGHLDIAALSMSVPGAPADPNAVFVYLGAGDGTFKSPNEFTLTTTPWDLIAQKLSGNRVPDIAIANASAGSISVLLNQAPAVVPTATPTPTTVTSAGAKGNQTAPTSTSFASNNNPAKPGQAISFFATVNPPAGSTKFPTGTVTFLDGTQPIGTGNLDATGNASFSTSGLAAGAHIVSAAYNGDANFTSSKSQAMAQTISAQSSGAVATPFTITSSLNPSIYGQAVTLTATGDFTCPNCTTAPGPPTGTVTFYDGGAQIGSSALFGGSTGLTISSLIAGNRTITVQFSSTNSSFGSGSGGPFNQIVNQSATSTTLSSSVNPSVYGQGIAFSVNVSAVAPGVGTPTGPIVFTDGTSNIGTATLSGGRANLTLSALTVAAHNITAVYQGDNNFKSSSSAAIVQTVNQSGSATALNTSVNPSVFGQPIIFTIAVAPVAPGAGTPSGTAACLDGASNICNATLSNGDATFKTSTLAVGQHDESASYSGDIDFKPSASPTVVQVVDKSATLTTITSSANPSVYGQAVTLQAFVDAVAPGAGMPTGTVSFSDGNTVIGTVVLNGSIGTLTVPILAVGNHGIVASYTGDNNFLASSSSALAQTVNKGASIASMTTSLNPAIVGQTVTLTANVSIVSPSTGTPTGSFIFMDGTTNLGTAAISSGVSKLTISSLGAGTHGITAVYGGDGNFLLSTSPAVSEVVVAPDFSLTVSTPQGTITAGQTFKSEIQLTPLNGLTGSVSVSCNGVVPQGTCTVTPASGKFDGKTPLTATLTIQTTANSSSVAAATGHGSPKNPLSPLYPAAAILALPFMWSRKRRRQLVLLLGTAILVVGCGSQSGSKLSTTPKGTPPGTYNFTVQAQSGSLQHSGQVTLVTN